MQIRRPRRVLVAAAACTMVTGGLATAMVANAATAGCSVAYSVSTQWSNGFTGAVSITNLGDPVTSWTLKWSYTAGQTVTQAWNATVTQSGSAVTATDAGYNGAVATFGTASFGFNANWNGSSNPAPASFTFNGT